MPVFLEDNASKTRIKEVEKTKPNQKKVKNRWRNEWMTECDFLGNALGKWCRKLVEKPGVAFCLLCHQDICYGQNGKKVLHKHANDDQRHQEAVRQQALTQTLPG
jgi:hypothetical protein